MRYHYTPSRMTKTLNLITPSVSKSVGLLVPYWWGGKVVQLLGKTVWLFL